MAWDRQRLRLCTLTGPSRSCALSAYVCPLARSPACMLCDALHTNTLQASLITGQDSVHIILLYTTGRHSR
eukprot:6189710-Pleurochrysis_carterae.AAC.4